MANFQSPCVSPCRNATPIRAHMLGIQLGVLILKNNFLVHPSRSDNSSVH
ncbi:hypothetical protein [Rubritalea tangerina]